MDFLTLAKERFSVRDFKDTPIEPSVMEKILEAGKVAPTAANHQPQRIYIIKSREALEKIRALTPCAFNAPVVLMMTYNTEEQWKNVQEPGIAAGEEDVSIVASHMMLEAWNLGVASCWVNAFPNSKVAEAFQIPEDEKVVLLMPMGYPADGVKPTVKHSTFRPESEIIREL